MPAFISSERTSASLSVPIRRCTTSPIAVTRSPRPPVRSSSPSVIVVGPLAEKPYSSIVESRWAVRNRRDEAAESSPTTDSARKKSPPISISTTMATSDLHVDDLVDDDRAHDHEHGGEAEQDHAGAGVEQRPRVGRVDHRDEHQQRDGQHREDAAGEPALGS